MATIDFSKYYDVLDNRDFIEYTGKVSKVVGLTIESNGPEVNIGEICKINALRENKVISAEAVGFRDNKVLLMPLGDMNGIGPGSKVVATRDYLSVGVGNALIGRVIDGMGRPIDGKGGLPCYAEFLLISINHFHAVFSGFRGGQIFFLSQATSYDS